MSRNETDELAKENEKLREENKMLKELLKETIKEKEYHADAIAKILYIIGEKGYY